MQAGTATLLLAGDVMTGRGIDQVLAHPVSPELYEGWVRDARDYVRLAEQASGPIPAPVPDGYLWGDALAAIARIAPDAHVVNLETAVTAGGAPWPGKGIHYRMHPANAGCLGAARVDVCTLANNHVLDWGPQGLADTLGALAQAGVRCCGAGLVAVQAQAPAVLPLDARHRLLVFAWAAPDCGVPGEWDATRTRPGVALLRDLGEAGVAQVADAVRAHRRAGDVVLLSIHWGANWVDAVPPAHRRFAHALVEGGWVDVVQGHSSHHPLPFEVYRGKLILYGCGDLINDYEGIGAHGAWPIDVGCLYAATVTREGGRLVRLRIVPLQRRAFRLVRAQGAARKAIRAALRLGEDGVRVRDAGDGDWVIEVGG